MFGIGKISKPKAVAFDIMGTVFPMAPLRPRLAALGLPPAALEGLYAATGRDAMALALTGEYKPWKDVHAAALDQLLAEHHLSPSDGAKSVFLSGMAELDARPGAGEAFAALRAAGIQVVALSNGSAEQTQKLFDRAGLVAEHIVSTDGVRLAKPRAEPYLHAAHVAGVEKGEMVMVAAHAWDVNGARAAGYGGTAYLNAERPFSPLFHKPDIEAATLPEIAQALAGL
jgi:2-haloacid dehalogenase